MQSRADITRKRKQQGWILRVTNDKDDASRNVDNFPRILLIGYLIIVLVPATNDNIFQKTVKDKLKFAASYKRKLI